MSSNDCGDTISIICGDVITSSENRQKSILNTKTEIGRQKPASEKHVKLVEPLYVHEKKIKEKRLKVDELIIEQIAKRTDEFEDLKKEYLPRICNKIWNYFLKVLLLWLLVTMIKASICHSNNCYCEVFWYESILAAVFGIFTSSYKDVFPS